MDKKLVIAEKPSVAQTIAKALDVKERKDGWIEGDGYLISWCFGHMLRIQDDPAFRKWTLDTLPIIPAEWHYEAIPESRQQLDTLFRLIGRRDVTSLVCATDAGREGELIFRLVYNASGTRKPFERLWISSLEEASIRKGFEDLKDGRRYDDLYESALARSHADWLVGVNATRLYTLAYSTDGGQMSVGRVQTPTLNMIVQRQKEIDAFRVTKQWAVVKDFGTWKMETEKFRSEKEADECLRRTRGKPTVIDRLETQRKRVNPPLLYSLTTLQQDANRLFGFQVQKTLDLMQSLYEKRLLSYPRTDSNYVTSDMETTLAKIAWRLSEKFAPGLKPTRIGRLVDDSKVSDHYAVIVTGQFLREMNTSQLPEDERKILLLVVTRILAAVSVPYEYDETKVSGTCEGYAFAGSGRKEVEVGWKGTEARLLKRKEKTAAVIPSDVVEGGRYLDEKTEVATRDTQPPRPYTENTLLGAMDRAGAEDMPEDAERKGIGTSATRAGIIERLIEVGYVIRQKAKSVEYLIPTDKGKRLIEIVASPLKDVKTTADWEWRLKDVEKGTDDGERFCSDIAAEISGIVKSSANVMEGADMVFGRCPVCGSPVLNRGRLARCSGSGCGMALYRNNNALNGHTLTDKEMKELFHGNDIEVSLLSKRTNRWYKTRIRLRGDKEGSDKYFGIEFLRDDRKDEGKKERNGTDAGSKEAEDADGHF